MATSSASKRALQLSPNALTVLEKRYLIKDDAGQPVEGWTQFAFYPAEH